MTYISIENIGDRAELAAEIDAVIAPRYAADIYGHSYGVKIADELDYTKDSTYAKSGKEALAYVQIQTGTYGGKRRYMTAHQQDKVWALLEEKGIVREDMSEEGTKRRAARDVHELELQIAKLTQEVERTKETTARTILEEGGVPARLARKLARKIVDAIVD